MNTKLNKLNVESNLDVPIIPMPESRKTEVTATEDEKDDILEILEDDELSADEVDDLMEFIEDEDVVPNQTSLDLED